MSRDDAHFVQIAIQEAQKARGQVEPNPMVGAVLVDEQGVILSQAGHQKFGGFHAEILAMDEVGAIPRGATLYVTLEPCCHTNKKTAPCVPAIVGAGVSRVVVGAGDPNPLVHGSGIRELLAAGVHVTSGVLEKRCQQLIAPYMAGMVHRRPYVTLKWAQTGDGYVAGPSRKRLQISNPQSQREAHRLRAVSDAILVGVETALSDNPLLTTRDVSAGRPLIRVVVDSNLRLPMESRLVQTAGEHRTVVYCSELGWGHAERGRMEAMGVRVAPAPVGRGGGVSLGHVLEDLYLQGVTHLLVDAGPTIARGFMDLNLADRVWIFRSARELGEAGGGAPRAAVIDWPASSCMDLGGDVLTEYLNPGSPVFFELVASPEFPGAFGQ